MKNKYLILMIVICMDFLAGMEFDLFVPSFPALQSHFHLSAFWVEALLSVNFIGYCLSLFVVGDLADRFGRKYIIIAGLLLFILGSIFCLVSNTYFLLIVGRFLQGIGVAAPAILSFLIISDLYPLKEQQFLLAIMNGTMNLSVAIAPILGSYLTLYFQWYGNFWALLMLGSAILLLVIFFIPHIKLSRSEKITTGYLSLFKSKPIMWLTLYFVVSFIPYWIFVGISPLLYIKSFDVSLKYFGFYQGTLAFVFATGSVLFGLMIKHMDRYDEKKMLHLSNVIAILSFITIFTVVIINSHNPLVITCAFLPLVIGQIIPVTILYPHMLELLPQAKARVTALSQGGRLVLTSIALQIAGYFYQGNFVEIGVIILFFILAMILVFYKVMGLNIHAKQTEPAQSHL